MPSVVNNTRSTDVVGMTPYSRSLCYSNLYFLCNIIYYDNLGALHVYFIKKYHCCMQSYYRLSVPTFYQSINILKYGVTIDLSG